MAWDEVITIWEAGEAGLPRWITHYQKRGFDNWRDWRTHTTNELQPQNLHWYLYKVSNPMKTVPLFKGGPFRAWIKNYYGSLKSPTFAEIVKHSDVGKSSTIQEMIANFPANTTIIGLKTTDGIVIIEGMHRCTALALAELQRKPIQTTLSLILADYGEKEVPLMGQEDSPAA